MRKVTNMPLDAHISVRLRSERVRLGLSQQQAAKMAGVRREMWAKYEAGAQPGATILSGMAEAGMDLLFVLTGQRSPRQNPAEALSEDERQLRDAFRLCQAEARLLLLQTAALLANPPRKKRGPSRGARSRPTAVGEAPPLAALPASPKIGTSP
ncbi:MAG: helix-turn-helix transcriptional regulator [Burkholderiaceae bacterium]|jgi:transcriptional regulator with XRE-family HTH domain|nr:helix-turn-helix transcriptional regulator [Burkholderiaceae bacterium]